MRPHTDPEGSAKDDTLPAYLVERYLPGSASEQLTADIRRAMEAAALVTAEGSAIRYVRSTFVPRDEMCFYLFEASSAGLVARTMERAGIPYERISEAVSLPAENVVGREGGHDGEPR